MSLIKFISQMLSKQKLKKLPVNYGVIWFHRFASNAALESERMFPQIMKALIGIKVDGSAKRST